MPVLERYIGQGTHISAPISRKPRKRKKVDLSPNSKFANIEDIYRAQLAVGEAESGLDQESDSESLSKAGSCILVVMN